MALHDVDTVLLVEVNARRHISEAGHFVLARQPTLPGRVVDEIARHTGLTARYQLGLARDLLDEVRLVGAARAHLHSQLAVMGR